MNRCKNLFASLDPHETVANVAKLSIEEGADWCALHLLETDARIQCVQASRASSDKPGEISVQRQYFRMPAPEQAQGRSPASGFVHVIQNGRTEEITDLSDATLESWNLIEEDRARIRGLEIARALCVPIRARDKLLGALTLGFRGVNGVTRPIAIADWEELVECAALSIDHSRVYSNARSSAQVCNYFLAGISHDLKNPLTAILTSVEMMSMALPDRAAQPANFDRSLKVVRVSAERMRHLVEGILSWAKSDCGASVPERCKQDVTDVMKQAYDLMRPIAEEKGVRIRCECPSDLLRMLADREQILRVFSNLIGNSIKFSNPGSEIRLRSWLKDKEVCFAVSDDGCGIASDQIPRIFERFWQAQDTAELGSGLGLSITREIIEAHGGTIWVESAVSKGTTFYFTVPIAS